MHLTINNRTYTSQQLQHLAKDKLSTPTTLQWEKHIYTFILQWLDDTPHIETQTSGSTGTPKTIQLAKQQMTLSAQRTSAHLKLKTGDTTLLCLPANYIAGRMMIVRAITQQFNLIIIPPSSDPLQHIHQKIDFAAMIPLQLINTLKHPQHLNCIKKLIVGGGSLPPNFLPQLQNLQTKIYETYGMTETATHIAIKPINGENPQPFFTTLQGINIDTDNNNQLIIKDTQTKQIHHTNDIVKTRSHTTFIWLGRSDNIINTASIKLNPEIIEQPIAYLINQPYAISSIPHPHLGEEVVLVVQDLQWNKAQIQAIQEKLKQTLHKHQVPKRILFVKKLPQTSNHKIDRKTLKQKLNKIYR